MSKHDWRPADTETKSLDLVTESEREEHSDEWRDEEADVTPDIGKGCTADMIDESCGQNGEEL